MSILESDLALKLIIGVFVSWFLFVIDTSVYVYNSDLFIDNSFMQFECEHITMYNYKYIMQYRGGRYPGGMQY